MTDPWKSTEAVNPFFGSLVAPHRDEVLSGDDRVKLFLAGSIDMGKAVEWQQRVTLALQDMPVSVFNPRRPDFDPTMEQSIDNAPFREQVDWELDHLRQSDVIAFYFDPAGMAPVTLLELGLNLSTKRSRCVVYCPPGYWRRANVQITVDRYHGVWCDSEEHFIQELRGALWDMGHNSARFRK